MGFHCASCGTETALSADGRVHRGDECPSCKADLHTCRNCLHYDTSAYNDCREPQADRVLEKDKRNFCDYFSPRSGARSKSASPKADAMKALDDLFKK